jgi:hypothetical protein
MNAWTSRAFTRAEAAKLCGIPLGTVAVLLHRARHVAVLFSEKRKGRRWFSLRDIAVLRIASELEKAGAVWLSAIAHACEVLDDPPVPDAILVAPTFPMRGRGSPRVISDRAVPRLTIDRTSALVPIGKFVSEIMEAADAMAV